MGSTVYDSRIRPSGMNDTDAATLVTVNLFVRSFSKIDDVKMVRDPHPPYFFTFPKLFT